MKFRKQVETVLQMLKEKAQNKISKSNSSRTELYNRLAVYRPEYDKVVSWYERVTGLSEVRVAQDRVLESQKQFMKAQDRRRDVSVELRTIQNKLKDIRNELINTSRSEDRYIELVTQEHALLKQENSIIDRVNYCEKDERDSFILLSTTLKDSHDRERIQAERTKYVSIVGSILGTIIGIIGSTVINAWKMNEFKRMVLDAKLDSSNSNKSDQIKHLLLQVQKQNKMLKKAQLNSNKLISTVEPDWKYTDRDVIILTTINCTIVALSAYLVSKLF
ncbi:coiled-coil domain-containing protein 51-like [Rhopalosiphum maidis]|uniref:coiled-coil domain-containing protein 51-like n=1 Tax=Rhopalosiphum maidis TaxID=43146 RepID=UPI000EFF56E0|nr:coiled-coil domain-containing protein 51-like [Rhopalosiphum maidis]XP_026804765.1 coiled-coil domain-containing protein 51-like [Rhopalosiphum maidis]XP_026804766.1 coiled-coil domain-containing protein 51-like [Rhopalosiphum maidis]XP_026804767.1 coiled-coil domain-containing protein 51-like [Rhopalosiphum maidis]